MRWLVMLVVLCLAPQSAAVVDPYRSLDAADNLQLLEDLRPQLAAQPEDQELLGRAVLALANLSWHGHHTRFGRVGPWHRRAAELAAHRADLRDGPPAHFRDALPELWAAAACGDNAAVVAGLDAWGEAAAGPDGLALRCIATRDFRLLAQRTDRTTHGRLALLHAALDTNADAFAGDRSLGRGLWSNCEDLMRYHAGGYGRRSPPFGAVIADAARLLADPAVPDDEARRHARELIVACGGEPPPGDDRAALVAAAIAAGSTQVGARPEPYVVAYRFCTAYRDHPDQGLWDEAGGLRLVGFGDRARWMRDRLAVIARLCVRMYACDDDYLPTLRAEVPNTVLAGYAHSWSQRNSKQPRIEGQFLRAVAAEAADPHGHEPAMLGMMLGLSGSYGDRDALAAAVAAVADAWRRSYVVDGMLRQRCGFTELVDAALVGRAMGALGSLYPQALALDPWAIAKTRRDIWLAPDGAYLDVAGLDPDLRWHSERIAYENLDHAAWPEDAPRYRFGVTFAGQLLPGEAGTYRIELRSNDAARLAVDGVTTASFDEDGERSTWLDLELDGEPVAVAIEWAQGRGDASCVLSWRPPGASGLSVIPAANLRAADGTPGLAAALYRDPGASRQALWHLPSAAMAKVERMPYAYSLVHDLAHAMVEDERYTDALALARRCADTYRSGRWRHLEIDMAGFAVLASEDSDEVLEAVGGFRRAGYVPHEWDLVHGVVYRIRSQRVGPQVLAMLGAEWLAERTIYEGYVLSQLALDAGELSQARRGLETTFTAGTFTAGWRSFVDAALTWALLSERERKGYKRQRVERWVGSGSCPKIYKQVWRVLQGELDREGFRAAAESLDETDEGAYWLGLFALVAGDHERAQELLATVDGRRAPTAEGILAWYAARSPEELAALPTWTPPTPASAPPTTADDF